MDIVRLYQDYSVDFLTEGHKHCRPGWANTPCPWCIGNEGYHLGYNLQNAFYICWRCGWHPITPTLSKLLNLKEHEVNKLIAKYGLLIPKLNKEPIVKIRAKAHRMPSNTGPLNDNHIRYLEKRNFDPNALKSTYLLVGTGPVSLLDGIDYKHRVIAPVIWNAEQVSFQGRDITGKDPLRYRACPEDRELIKHKHIIYGRQDLWKDVGIATEGVTDVWRLGTDSFCTFGIKYTHEQVRIIAKTFKRVAVCFDDDPQAITQANKLVSELKFRGVDAFRVDIEGDPGSMNQEEANYLVKQLIK